MEEERKEYMFNFGVYPITMTQAGELFDKIIDLVEAMDDAYMGGGYGEYIETGKEAEE